MILIPLHSLRCFRFDFLFWLDGSGSARASLEPDTPESHDHDHGCFIRSFIGLSFLGIGIGIGIGIPSRMVTFTLD